MISPPFDAKNTMFYTISIFLGGVFFIDIHRNFTFRCYART